MQKDIRANENKRKPQFEAGSLEQQDNLLIEMLSSDKIIDIGIFVCFLGVIILGLCCYLVQGHLRFHLGVILFLMLGLGGSLMIYKCMNSTQSQSNQEAQNQESQCEQQDIQSEGKQNQVDNKEQKSENSKIYKNQ